ncbi:MAG: hypothetical protein E6929_07470 [Clostridium sp.]|nr:hypothetical protein [Clostridium sp.]
MSEVKIKNSNKKTSSHNKTIKSKTFNYPMTEEVISLLFNLQIKCFIKYTTLYDAILIADTFNIGNTTLIYLITISELATKYFNEVEKY